MEINELNKNAMGGTEMMQKMVHDNLPKELLDDYQIICSRSRELDPNRKKIYYLHDLATDPEVRHLAEGGWKKYDKLVFVSNWQMQMYNLILGVPYSESIVIKNCIETFEAHEKPTDKVRLIYHPTPHRGLNIVFAAFQELAKEFGDDIHLDVFSSFNLYGWPVRDEPFKELFKAMDDHPQITNHGTVSNSEIRESLKNSHIFAYPSIWPETSCICLMEAMSAGLTCIHPNYAALPETSGNMTHMYQWEEDINRHTGMFYAVLKNAVEFYLKNLSTDVVKNSQSSVNGNSVSYANLLYNKNRFVTEWADFLNGMKSVPKRSTLITPDKPLIYKA